MTKFDISVAIPALNEEYYLPQLLESLCAQRNVRLDIVVAEGDSDDRTVQAVKEVAARNNNPDVEIRVFTVEQRNVSYQRNYAVEQSRFGLLLFLDSDVRIPHPHWLHKVAGKHLRRKSAITTCRFRPFEKSVAAELYYSGLFAFHQIMRWFNPYAIGAMLLTSRECFERVGGFDVALTVNEDANFVKRVSAKGRFDVLTTACQVSARRFIRGGFIKTGIMYVRMFLHRTRHGEMRTDMGYWDNQHYDAPSQ